MYLAGAAILMGVGSALLGVKAESDPLSVRHLGLSDAVTSVFESEGIRQLYPPQHEALEVALEGRNTVVSIPTASGKSLIAYVAMLRRILDGPTRSRGIYIVPLKAMATEKLEDFKRLGKACGLSVGLAIGDARGEVRRIREADILVCTSEKLDALLRQSTRLLDDVSIVVTDEVHLINDTGRGPTLEMNLARVLHLAPSAQIIALSATVGNVHSLASWLDGIAVISTWRPVRLQLGLMNEHVVEHHKVVDTDGEHPSTHRYDVAQLTTNPVQDICEHVTSEEGQILVFVNTRRSSIAVARDIGRTRCRRAADGDLDPAWSKHAESYLGLEEKTRSSQSQAEALKGGCAFHHAGLTSKQRRYIENLFKQRIINVLCATPTLAAGVNLPARSVLVRDLKRWSGGGMDWLSVMEIHQMMGRAGRPQYDSEGEAILMVKHEHEKELLAERFIHAEPEPIKSRLHHDSALRMHSLSVVASDLANTTTAILGLFGRTFLGHTIPTSIVNHRIRAMLDWHIEQGLLTMSEATNGDADVRDEPQSLPCWVTVALSCLGADEPRTWTPVSATTQQETESDIAVLTNPSPSFVPATELPDRRIGPMVVASEQRNWDRTFTPTSFGREVVRLCIDPLSGIRLRRGLRRCVRRLVRDSNDQPVTTFGLLHLITYLPDFVQIRSNRSDELRLQDIYAVESHGLVVDESEIGPIEFSSLLKSADVIQSWIDEVDLALIEDDRGVSPGDLRMRCELARWLLYAAQSILGTDTNFSDEHEPHRRSLNDMIVELHTRVRYGCREDALPLIVLPNIGRKRARDLIGVGIHHPRDLLDLSRKMYQTLIDIRGWSVNVVDRLIKDAHEEVEAGRKVHRLPRDDDIPLQGEVENS